MAMSMAVSVGMRMDTSNAMSMNMSKRMVMVAIIPTIATTTSNDILIAALLLRVLELSLLFPLLLWLTVLLLL